MRSPSQMRCSTDSRLRSGPQCPVLMLLPTAWPAARDQGLGKMTLHARHVSQGWLAFRDAAGAVRLRLAMCVCSGPCCLERATNITLSSSGSASNAPVCATTPAHMR